MEFIYEKNRIYVNDADGNMIVEATFPMIKEGVANVDHTWVDPSLRGQGVASQLMQAVVRKAHELDLRLVGTCPYAQVWFKKHKNDVDIIDWNMQEELHPECKIV
jgi:uncharacterized protein